MNIHSIRGAITIEENTKECILKNANILLEEIISQNNIKKQDIINIIFTATKDITKAYPAIEARKMGIDNCGILCMQELYIEGSLEKCLRVMITAYLDTEREGIRHIYLKDAKKLRPDISLKNKKFSVAIDGPSGTGKSTVAKMVAKELGFLYVDTGAMFRAVGLYCIKNDINIEQEKELSDNLKNIEIELKFEDGMQKIYLNDENVTEKIRTPQIAEAASKVAKNISVREKLLVMQREIAKGNRVIMDGRDIGTNILPNAEVKIYLDADTNVRAERRCNELKGNNVKFDYQEIKKSIIERDFRDKNREIFPLKKADTAIEINTTNLDIYEVCEKIIKLIKAGI